MCFRYTVDCNLLEKILEDVGFYGEYPDLRDEEHLVLVTLYDYSARNFQRRHSINLDSEIPSREEIESKHQRSAGRTYIYPPAIQTFKARKFICHFAHIQTILILESDLPQARNFRVFTTIATMSVNIRTRTSDLRLIL